MVLRTHDEEFSGVIGRKNRGSCGVLNGVGGCWMFSSFTQTVSIASCCCTVFVYVGKMKMCVCSQNSKSVDKASKAQFIMCVVVVHLHRLRKRWDLRAEFVSLEYM